MRLLDRLVPGTIATVVIIGMIFLDCSGDRDRESFFPELGDYADLYLRGSYDLLHMVKVRERDTIARAAAVAAACSLNGGSIVSAIGTPHIMYGGACAADVPGQPGIAPDSLGAHWGYRGQPPLGEGDFLMVANPAPAVEAAHSNGCFVLGIGFPMTTNRHSPPDFNDHPNYHIEDMCDAFLYTWGPKEDGLVTPELTPVPYLKILPTSPMTVVAYWTVTAQIAYNLTYSDTSGTAFGTAETYLDTLMTRLRRFHRKHIADLHAAGDMMAERVLSGGKLYPWSGRDEFWVEANGTAGGLMGVYPLDVDSLTTKDVVILAAANATPEDEIAMARRIKEKGALLVGLYPFERGDGYPMDELASLCDISLNNMSGDIHGVVSLPGYEHAVIPTTGMMNNYIYWGLTGAYVQAMEKRGETPHYWMSYHVPGGREYDESIRDAFLERGY